MATRNIRLLLVQLDLFFSIGLATVFTIQNCCSYIILPTTHSSIVIADGSFALPPGGTIESQALSGWSGHFWLKCVDSGEPPVTLAEFSLAAKDFYDVSLVDGYNVGVGHVGGGAVVACKSACVAFHMPEYCCNGDHSTLETYDPTAYSLLFKGLCLSAYSYAYDDRSSTFTCSDSDYSITFCVN
ncbi:hypothetical protein ABFS83_02G123900 [Erythranthe nasuta]